MRTKILSVEVTNIQTLEDQMNQWLQQYDDYPDLIRRIEHNILQTNPPRVIFWIFYDETELAG
jgi:hypothetical protein